MKLKPCPFCGGEADIESWHVYDSWYWEGVCECKRCGAKGSAPQCEARINVRPEFIVTHEEAELKARQGAIKAWNTRANDLRPIAECPYQKGQSND